MIPSEHHDENEEGIGVSDLSTLILDFFVFFAAFLAAFFRLSPQSSIAFSFCPMIPPEAA
jgi:hypothetical protein